MKSFALALAVCATTACGSPKPAGDVIVSITDASGAPIAARIAIFDASGAAVHFGSLDLYNQRQGHGACAIAPTALATWSGFVVGDRAATFPVGTGACQIEPGHYRAVVWHGIDFERTELAFDAPGRIDAKLVRAWTAPGSLQADMHVHAAKSDDSTMPDEQRALALVASGIQIAGIANHNVASDLAPAIAALHLEDKLLSIASSELTSESLHVGAYPVPLGTPPAPADTLVHADAAKLFAIAHALPTNPIVQVNHPRFRYGALFDITKWDGVAWPPPFPLAFDAVETIAGYSASNTPDDPRIDDGVRDLYTLTEHGKLVAAMGNSDTHDFTWVFDGTARTLVYLDTRTPEAFAAAIRARRTIATTCPFLDVRANDVGPGQTAHGTHVAITVDVHAATFCHADRIRVTVGGKLLAETRGTHWAGTIEVDHATWIGVTVDGTDVLPLEQTGTYQRDKWKKPGVTPYAVISPILVEP